MSISKDDQARLIALTETYKQSQGEYLPCHHGPGSWATTYSNEFIAAAAEIYLIFKRAGYRKPLLWLSFHFVDSGILSCRGTIMDIDRVKYLYVAHIKRCIEEGG